MGSFWNQTTAVIVLVIENYEKSGLCPMFYFATPFIAERAGVISKMLNKGDHCMQRNKK